MSHSQLSKLINNTLMGVFASLYESKLVDKVCIGDAMKLFGASKHAEFADSYVYFTDAKFLSDYKAYKNKQHATLISNTQDNDSDTKFDVPHEINPKITIH